MRALFAALLTGLLLTGTAGATPPADTLAALRRGINITGWFRFPGAVSRDALQAWIGDGALAELRRVGFTFVRLPVDPAILSTPDGPSALVTAIRRLHKAGLAAVVSLHPNGWHLEAQPADHERLLAAWRRLAPLLKPLDERRTVAELLNEPVFPSDVAAWQSLQHRLLLDVRQALPGHTVVLTGNDWGSVGGLTHLTPEADGNLVYSVHLYEPAELTSLAAWRGGLDRAALAQLPFPVSDEAACTATGARTNPDTAGVIRFYCAQQWDGRRLSGKLAEAAQWARQHGAAVMLGEFGASSALNETARLAWLRTVREAAEREAMGWALWGYDDVMGLNVSRPPGNHPALPNPVLRSLGLNP